MDKNKIKSYAVWARRAMIEAVKDRAFKVGIEENKILDIERLQGGFKVVGREEIFNIPSTHRDTLVKLINEKGYEQVIEEVAYTWFNRFMGLRFMEVNDYLPTSVRILSSEDEGKTEPDVLSKINDIEDELNLNLDYVYELQDKGTEQAREELYKYILIKQCNELGKIIPQMFEKIQDYTELLLPDNLLQEGSVIRKMVTDIDEEDWKEEVEIIGWMYQYYISEKKDEVFAALKKNVKITKENIPAATQLFTPKWIVKYMVENSLGRLWLEGHPNEELQKEWKYYLEETEQEPEVEEELKKIREEHSHLTPEDIKVLDPCMGSGHILVYAFDVLYQIYKEAGYGEREIPRKILQNNIYGLDIDDRAAQLASFALIMKARGYNRRLFREIEREELELNLCSIQESNGITKEAIDYFANGDQELKEELEYLVEVFKDSKEYGSILEVEKIKFNILRKRIKEIEEDNLIFGDYREILLDKLGALLKQCEIMTNKYEVCVTNPPYMGRGSMNSKLRIYIDNKYLSAKNDLYATFIEKGYDYIKSRGYFSAITQSSWMFLSYYNLLRKNVVENKRIIDLIQLGARAFDDINGEVVQTVSFIISNRPFKQYKGVYINLKEGRNCSEKEEEFLSNGSNRYYISQNEFINIPGNPIAYWISNHTRNLFLSDLVKNNIVTVGQILTGNNEKYLRYIWEVNGDDIGINKRWLKLAKGGPYRKWFGNINTVINWTDEAIIHYKSDKIARMIPDEYWYRKGITWTRMSSDEPNFRVLSCDEVHDTAGSAFYVNNKDIYNNILALMNSVIAKYMLSILNPTLSSQLGDIEKIPFIINDDGKISKYVSENIQLAQKDWDSFETSSEFKSHLLLKGVDGQYSCKISSNFLEWEEKLAQLFNKLKYNEEELNRIFIDTYGLQDELTPEVEDKDITIRKADRERDIRSFISYAVGCMFGRYSIDSEGLIYAGGDFSDRWKVINDKWHVRKIEKDEEGNIISDFWIDATFIADVDNIIPITEDEYFEDDIVSRFIEFVRVVYGADTLEENLDFIAESLGVKANETSRQTIRRYFLKEFYKDHLKVYQKRPIYWMFDSGKNDGFKALVYMHRYNESTVAKLRTDYLHSLQRKYEAEILRLQTIAESTTLSAREKTQAKKNIDKINKKIEECKLYDQVVAHVANERISIDLDDGVKHNYGLFQGIKVPTDSGKEVKMDLLAKI